MLGSTSSWPSKKVANSDSERARNDSPLTDPPGAAR
jgi:hypothetical protein